MVELETRRALHVVVPPVAEGVVRADDDGLAAPGQLRRDELLFVVFLKRGAKLLDEVRVGDGEGFDVCFLGEVSVDRVARGHAGVPYGYHLPATTSDSCGESAGL